MPDEGTLRQDIRRLGFRKPKQDAEEEMTENGTVFGVDLGVNEIAVTSTARFFSAGELNPKRREV